MDRQSEQLVNALTGIVTERCSVPRSINGGRFDVSSVRSPGSAEAIRTLRDLGVVRIVYDDRDVVLAAWVAKQQGDAACSR